MLMISLKKSLPLACLLLFFANTLRADTSALENAKDEVNIEFEKLAKAATALDSDAYFAFFDQQNFSGLNADGTIWTDISQLHDVVAPGFAAIKEVTSLNFDKVHLTAIDANTVILVNEFTQTVVLTSGDKITFSGGGTQVWSKASDTWKIVSVSASNKPQH